MVEEVQKSIKDSTKIVMLAGAVGAMAPNLAQLVEMMNVSSDKFEWPHINFYVATILYGLMGLAVVLFGKEKAAWKGFLTGTGAPALFSSAGTVAVSVAAISFGSVAYAQGNTVNQAAVPDSVTMKIITQQKIDVIAGSQIFRTEDTLTVKIPRQQMSVEYQGQTVQFKIPEKRDSVTVNVDIKSQKGKRHLIRGFFPMMQQKIANKKITVEIQDMVKDQEEK